jgi:hypothetical protein
MELSHLSHKGLAKVGHPAAGGSAGRIMGVCGLPPLVAAATRVKDGAPGFVWYGGKKTIRNSKGL